MALKSRRLKTPCPIRSGIALKLDALTDRVSDAAPSSATTPVTDTLYIAAVRHMTESADSANGVPRALGGAIASTDIRHAQVGDAAEVSHP